MPQYYIWTIGCQMNKAESERLGSLFEQQGYQATSTPGEADIIVLNSCVVRQSAENRAVSRLNALKPRTSHFGLGVEPLGIFSKQQNSGVRQMVIFEQP